MSLQRVASRIALLALTAVASGCAGPAAAVVPRATPPAMLDARLGDARITTPLAELAARDPLRAEERFRVREIGRDAGTSHHLVWIRDAEEPHRHDRHDLVVVVLRGHGTMLVGDETRAVGEGSILYVPRATVHAFRNEASEPAVAYAVYAPAFDPADRVAPDAPRPGAEHAR